MPTKVLDLEFNHLPPAIEGLASYRYAMILLRLNGAPLGKFAIELEGPCLRREQVHEVVRKHLAYPFAYNWLNNWMGYDGRPDPQPLPSATVAVCTRDRPEDLTRCLHSLQALRQEGQQMLVVDSASKEDTTRQVADSFPGVRFVREDQPGLDRARNRALREASTEVVAFIDDDAAADPGWLHALLRNFDDPEVLCVTGLTMPSELETEAQETFERVYPFARGFARRVYDRWLIPPARGGRVGAGVNMALRRRVLAEIGPFDEALDAGTLTMSGGDNDMFSRILARGYRIVYDPAAVNWHRHRRTHAELLAQAYGYGAGPYAAMTALWLRERDAAVFSLALSWLLRDQLPRLAGALLRLPGSAPVSIMLAELRGCAAGVGAYMTERRRRAGDSLR